MTAASCQAAPTAVPSGHSETSLAGKIERTFSPEACAAKVFRTKDSEVKRLLEAGFVCSCLFIELE